MIARCVELGYRINLPFGGGAPYDFIVDTMEKLIRVQVKRVYQEENSRNNGKHWVMRFDKSKIRGKARDRHYTKDDCDYIIGYSCEYNIAYVFPIEMVSNRWCFVLNPDEEIEGKHQKYREAWF